MSNKFREINRDLAIVLPPNLEGWLKGDSLARFIVEIVEQLDTSGIEEAYGGGGSQPYPPKVMLALLFFCYAVGIFSSRKVEKATYELIPVIFIAGGMHPDHDSINTFRKRFLTKLEALFVQILFIACELGVFKLGDISIDGTKILANASKHKAMSWEYANKLEEQLKTEVKDLLKKVESGEDKPSQDVDIPSELNRRVERLEKIAEIKKEIEARAQVRYEQEKAEHDAKMAARKAKEEERGRKLGGKPPTPPEPGPRPKDQINFTDEESRIMPISGGGFAQAYNAQASVDMDSFLIIGNHISQKTNDKKEVEPALGELDKLPDEVGKVERAAADSGYFSEENTKHFENEGIEPYIADSRVPHNQSLKDRLEGDPEPPKDPTSVEAMKHRMKTKNGKEFYAKRKSTVETVFGIIKERMGFRRFMLRGLESVRGEWELVCIAFNLKRLYVLSS